jgi:hypothetical protein
VSSATRGDGSHPVADRLATAAADGPAGEAGVPEATEAQEAAPPGPSEEQASVDVMRLLNAHVPLTLLADLAQPTGPDSPDILEHEGLPEVAWWETAVDDQS